MKFDTENGLRVIFRLEDKFFSIHSSYVEAMEVIESIRKVPQSPNYLRGIIELRGKVIPLVDLRVVLGMTPLEDNNKKIYDRLLKFKDKHEQLEAVLSDDAINLEKHDSETCELTDFINVFQSDNIFFKETIAELRYPHQKLHDTIVSSAKERINGSVIKADMLLEQVKEKEFPRFLRKIDSSIDTLKKKANEVYIVLGFDGRLIGLTVDSIFAVDKVDEIDKQKAGIYEFFSNSARKLIESVGRNKKFDGLIINMSAPEFFQTFRFDSLEK